MELVHDSVTSTSPPALVTMAVPPSTRGSHSTILPAQRKFFVWDTLVVVRERETERQRDRETERERERERDASACMRRHRLSPWPPAGPTVSERTVVGEVRSGGVQPLPCTPLFMAMSAASAAARLSNPTSTSPPPLPPPLPAPAPAAAPASDHWLTFPSVPRCVATSAASPAAAPSGSFTASVVGRRSSRNRPFLAGRPPGDVAAPAPAPAPEGAPGRFLARRRA